MSIIDKLLEIIKDILPLLKSAAEKSFEKLPEEKQTELINISKLVEVVKQAKGQSIDQVAGHIIDHTGFSYAEAELMLVHYLMDKGKDAGSLQDALELIWNDMETHTVTGLKGFFNDMCNTIATVIAGIDWEALVMGIGEYVYRKYIKDKIKI